MIRMKGGSLERGQLGMITNEEVRSGEFFKFVDRKLWNDLEPWIDCSKFYYFERVEIYAKSLFSCKLLIHFSKEELIYLDGNRLVTIRQEQLLTIMNVWMIPL